MCSVAQLAALLLMGTWMRIFGSRMSPCAPHSLFAGPLWAGLWILCCTCSYRHQVCSTQLVQQALLQLQQALADEGHPQLL